MSHSLFYMPRCNAGRHPGLGRAPLSCATTVHTASPAITVGTYPNSCPASTLPAAGLTRRNRRRRSLLRPRLSPSRRRFPATGLSHPGNLVGTGRP